MNHLPKWLCTCLLLLSSFSLVAQVDADELLSKVPPIRLWHHEQVQQACARIQQGPYRQYPQLLQEWSQLVQQVKAFRLTIEQDERLTDNQKFMWLRGLQEWLQAMVLAQKQQNAFLPQPGQVLAVYQQAYGLETKGASLLPLVKETDRQTGAWLCDNYALAQNPGWLAAKDYLLSKDFATYPDKAMYLLSQQPQSQVVDSLLVLQAFRDPESVYNYAAAQNTLGKKIQAHAHPLVQWIARLSLNRFGRLYFPFLDELYRGKLSMATLNPLVASDTALGYFQLLVRTRISYAKRMQMGDTPLAVKALTNRLKTRAIEQFVHPINALHDEPSAAIRFQVLDPLTPAELYYLAVLGEEELYTSSFVSGIYPRMFQAMDIPRSDFLLAEVANDYVKKFIRMAAAYNVLDNFLVRMETKDAENLMRWQVRGLEQSDNMEDAVDAVDTYASMGPSTWRSLMRKETSMEWQRCQQKQLSNGTALYGLMLSLYRSLDEAKVSKIWDSLGLSAPDYLPLSTVRTKPSGRVVVQQYFYGDKDGAVIFQSFLSKYTLPNWKIIRSSQWVEIQSVKGVPVSIFANYPLDEKTEADEAAQDSLNAYLLANGLSPTIVVHRGHSYFVNSTIRKLPASARLVVLGSCGGYQKLQEVLARSPQAQIIASKQIGAGVINQSMVSQISEALRMGKDLYWPSFWVQMNNQFSGKAKEGFRDYVPPHRNLGALFITAYQNWVQKQ